MLLRLQTHCDTRLPQRPPPVDELIRSAGRCHRSAGRCGMSTLSTRLFCRCFHYRSRVRCDGGGREGITLPEAGWVFHVAESGGTHYVGVPRIYRVLHSSRQIS